MAQTVLITLTTAGADTGPFNLYTNIDGYLSPFEVNVSKASLEAGFVSFLVPDAASIIRVQSLSSLCTNYIDLALVVTTTTTTSTSSTSTTSTTSTTTTAPVLADFTVSGSTSEAIGGIPTYDIDYDTYHVENMVGSDSFGPLSETSPSGSFNVICTVTKTSNGGLAEDVTQINWFKNASLQHTENYIAGDPIAYGYTFVGVVPGDDLDVQLVEG
jgi:hypothetical protein